SCPSMYHPPLRSSTFPYTTLFRSDLFRDACEKETELPLVIFIDANMPPDIAQNQLERWTTELQTTLPRVGHGFGPTGVFEGSPRSEEHTSELQSRENLVCRLLLEK